MSETKYGVKKFKSKSDVGIQVALSGLEGGAAVKVSYILGSECNLKGYSNQ